MDPAFDDLVGVLRTGDQATAKFLEAGRQDENADGVLRAFPGDVAGPLPVDVEQDVATLREGALDRCARTAVAGTVDVGPFEEGVGINQPLECLGVDEMIVAVGDLARTDGPRGH